MTRNDKIVFAVAVIAAVGLFLWGRSCGVSSVLKQAGSDTTVRKDSIRVVYQPTPYKVIEKEYVYVEGKNSIYTVHDTIREIELTILPTDTAAILKRFYETAYYKDTRDIKRGSITIEDTVSQNRIKGRSVNVVVADSVIKTTIVLRPPRNLVVYYTLSAMGSFQKPAYGIGGGMAVKLPNDMIYQFELKAVQGQRIMGEGRVMVPIRLFGKPK